MLASPPAFRMSPHAFRRAVATVDRARSESATGPSAPLSRYPRFPPRFSRPENLAHRSLFRCGGPHDDHRRGDRSRSRGHGLPRPIAHAKALAATLVASPVAGLVEAKVGRGVSRRSGGAESRHRCSRERLPDAARCSSVRSRVPNAAIPTRRARRDWMQCRSRLNGARREPSGPITPRLRPSSSSGPGSARRGRRARSRSASSAPECGSPRAGCGSSWGR